MCGIAGIVMKDGGRPDAAQLTSMAQALAHRGPDGNGEMVDGCTGLVHLRLAIIDPNGGQQPMHGTDCHLVGNGEIYNYIELKAEQLADTTFKSDADFEPVLHLIARDGVDAIELLRGMYALAIDFPGRGEMIVARDRFGIKPLYYIDTDTCFAFASEPAALWQFTDKQLLPDKLPELLGVGYVSGQQTIFAGIKRLLPGEILALQQGQIVAQTRIPALPFPARAKIKHLDAALMMFDHVFEESVRLHQRSDVPYGMFLSGGLDSTAVLTMMARLNSQPVKAFTCGFDSKTVTDEREIARHTAKALGAEHIKIEFTEQDFWQLLPQVAQALDDPVVDYATLPTFKLAAEASKSVKVILSGEGGDEVLAGYGRYRKAAKPKWLGGGIRTIKGRLDGLGILRDESINWKSELIQYQKYSSNKKNTNLQNAQALDFTGWLPDDLLTKLDRCLMRHGLEGRTPFLDNAMVDFAFNLPDRLKVRGRLGKYLLRAWLKEYGPQNYNPFAKKRGFTVPIGDWISKRGEAIGEWVAASEGVQAIAKPDAVKMLFTYGVQQYPFAAWTLLFYAIWHKIHFESGKTNADLFK